MKSDNIERAAYGASSRSSTGVLNVDFNKTSGKYRAIVRVSEKAHFLGAFDSKDDASDAVRAFRKERGIECQL